MAAEKVEESAIGWDVKKKAMWVTMRHGRKRIAGVTLYVRPQHGKIRKQRRTVSTAVYENSLSQIQI
jgi:hypothetical protein